MALTDLYARTCYPKGGTDLPVVVLMHGFSGDAATFSVGSLEWIARKGLFVVAPGMRGRDGASGSADASGRELLDVVAALDQVRTDFAGTVSADVAAIVGYSGGGGNALMLACRYPDLWAAVVSHFGMSDYGSDGTTGWYAESGAFYQGQLETQVGGTPAAVPNAYAARYAEDAIADVYTGGHLHLFHDDGDTVVDIGHSQRVGAAMLAAGRVNYTENYTTTSDDPRWQHASDPDPQTVDVAHTVDLWGTPLVDGTYTAWTVPTSGTVRVLGWMVTKRFRIWLGTTTDEGAGGGLDEVADVTYDTATGEYTVTPQTGACDVYIEQGGLTATASGITSATLLTVS